MTKNQNISGNNKPVPEQIQLLLNTSDLLRSAQLFIERGRIRTAKATELHGIWLLIRPGILTEWLSDVSMIFLSLSNKYSLHFLIHKILSLSHSSSY